MAERRKKNWPEVPETNETVRESIGLEKSKPFLCLNDLTRHERMKVERGLNLIGDWCRRNAVISVQEALKNGSTVRIEDLYRLKELLKSFTDQIAEFGEESVPFRKRKDQILSLLDHAAMTGPLTVSKNGKDMRPALVSAYTEILELNTALKIARMSADSPFYVPPNLVHEFGRKGKFEKAEEALGYLYADEQGTARINLAVLQAKQGNRELAGDLFAKELRMRSERPVGTDSEEAEAVSDLLYLADRLYESGFDPKEALDLTVARALRNVLRLQKTHDSIEQYLQHVLEVMVVMGLKEQVEDILKENELSADTTPFLLAESDGLFDRGLYQESFDLIRKSNLLYGLMIRAGKIVQNESIPLYFREQVCKDAIESLSRIPFDITDYGVVANFARHAYESGFTEAAESVAGVIKTRLGKEKNVNAWINGLILYEAKKGRLKSALKFVQTQNSPSDRIRSMKDIVLMEPGSADRAIRPKLIARIKQEGLKAADAFERSEKKDSDEWVRDTVLLTMLEALLALEAYDEEKAVFDASLPMLHAERQKEVAIRIGAYLAQRDRPGEIGDLLSAYSENSPKSYVEIASSLANEIYLLREDLE